VVDLRDYQENIDKIQLALNNLRTITFSGETVIILNSRVHQVREKLGALIPKNRARRGLVNGLGSIVKIITGNMDATDDREIKNQLNGLDKTNLEVSERLSRQIEINDEVFIRFKNITEHIKREQETINEHINNHNKDVYKKLSQEHKEIHLLQYIIRIRFNIDILTNIVNNIAKSLLLSKLNIIPKYILSKLEIEVIKNIIEKQNFNIQTDEQLYRILNLDTLVDKYNRLIFNIKIPIFDPHKFVLSHIIPLPIRNTTILHLPKYIIHNEYNIFNMDDKCTKIYNQYVCHNDEVFQKCSKRCLKSI